jgi:lipoprotein-anchoring transpeptidase ErfK/SrfK
MVTMQSSTTFAGALRNGLLFSVALLLAPNFVAAADTAKKEATVASKSDAKKSAAKKADTKKTVAGKADSKKAKAKAKAEDLKPGPLADLGEVDAPADVEHVANWVSYTHNNKKKAFVLIDKKQAQLYVFDPKGKLKSRTPILLGKAVGDNSVPGIGNKPMSKIKEDEKTTPAGRFLAQPAKNNRGEDIIWIDYNASVSMHRLRKVSAKEQRAQRMATEDASDNRISYGCVNVPHKFYDTVLKPTVVKQGAFVYVLPETRTPQQQFGSYDVKAGGKGEQVAQAAAAPGNKAGK